MKRRAVGAGKRKLKGQLIFEFVVAVVIFFAIVLYTLNYLNTQVTGYSNDYYTESVNSKAVQIAELLVMNKGNWTSFGPTVGVKVVGLAEDWPVLNRTKAGALNVYCNANYVALMNNLGVRLQNRLKIVLNETTSSGTVVNIVDCPNDQVPGNERTEARRYALIPNAAGTAIDSAVIYVYLW